MQSKMTELHERRKNQGPNVQNTLNAQAAAAQAQAQQAQAQQLLMNPNAMMQMGRGTGQARPQGPSHQQGFQHMQHPMQASPNAQQQVPMGMQMNPGGMGMNMGMAGPGAQPMGPNGPMGMMGGGQGQGQGRPQPAAPNVVLTPQEKHRIFEAANKRLQTLPEAQKSQMRQYMTDRLDQNHIQLLSNQNKDPALLFLQQQMTTAALNQKNNMATNPQQAAMLQQRHLNQGAVNPSPQQAPGNALGQLESLINQQKAGMIAQEAGQVVVPASSSHGHNANQPMGHMPNLTMQHSTSNMGHTPQSQPDQRPQQMAMSSPANQMPTRMQNQGSQMGGPSGGMPLAHSPGQPAASRPPGEPMMEAGQGAAQPPGGFNAGLDPRFSQANNQHPQAGGPNNGSNPILSTPFFVNLSPEHQRAFLALPAQKQMEFFQRGRGPRPANQQGFINQANGQGMNAGSQMPHNPMANGAPGQPPNGQPQGMTTARLDNMGVPQQILQTYRVPAEIKTWAELKQYFSRTPGMAQHLERLPQIQQTQY
ncbi:hypothetical protein IMZ48_04540, partial [Candidatus Bathyarchaeota archaeon]|nr:hypothetical protein [Candidatus Bathyarchaeota archaeon]